MKFTRTTGEDDIDVYGRWISECGKFSVQRFQYRKMPGVKDHQSVNPYYSVYAIEERSHRFATHLKNWGDVVIACENFK